MRRLGDPLHHRPPGLAPDDGGEVARREADGPRRVLEREAVAVAFLDGAEDLLEQGLGVQPEVPHHPGGQPQEAERGYANLR